MRCSCLNDAPVKKAAYTYLESGGVFFLRSPRSRCLFATPYSRKPGPCRPAWCLPCRDRAVAVVAGDVLAPAAAATAASAGTSARSARGLPGGTKRRPRTQPMALVQYQVSGTGTNEATALKSAVVTVRDQHQCTVSIRPEALKNVCSQTKLVVFYTAENNFQMEILSQLLRQRGGGPSMGARSNAKGKRRILL